MGGTPGLTVQQAYSIDSKIDDGLPQSGNATAQYVYGTLKWAANGSPSGNFGNGASDPGTGGPVTAGDGVSTAPSWVTCYDNANTAGAPETYSLSQSTANLNCALLIRFQ
jgi:hypothetical protein